ncbi:MAG: threonine synthase [Candidatus Pelagibacter sp. TMED118]|nr:MAG: threonine synthase [Candidatus Pelagibacter sp. TMED118]|tara:strand:+ start:52 stop:1419 length:1368 start_codon:yes stop_codon:yes gene_type:complete
MNYISTRNNSKKVSFEHVFLKGLSEDGGLFIPEKLKKFDHKELKDLSNLDYKNLAFNIIKLFTGDFIGELDLKNLINKSYENFRDRNVVKINKINKNYLLELYHGPTLAFKDIAMQLIGNFYEYYLNRNNKKINIIVATSGDTGAAAIDAIRGKKNINIFVLHPNKKISSVQRKLMTTTEDNNVFNLAINGNFDDCQNLVKSMFSDSSFSNTVNMSGVNSINWARIVAQTVYYFYSYFQIGKRNISFSVPTGNFGDVYAGYIAKQMGLPISKFIVATNQNDILHRAISNGDYKSNKVEETISPSMDIQVASNFERLLYDLYNKNSEKVKNIMKSIKDNSFKIEKDKLKDLQNDFDSESLNETEIINTIKKFYEENNIVIDPHTAIGVGAIEKLNLSDVVVLSTAHPCKFPVAIEKAISKTEKLPESLNYVNDKEEKFEVISNNLEKVKDYILRSI